MIHEVRQASNRAAAIVKWLEVIAAAVINQLDRHFIHAIMQLKPNMVLFHHTPNPCQLGQFNERLHHAQ